MWWSCDYTGSLIDSDHLRRIRHLNQIFLKPPHREVGDRFSAGILRAKADIANDQGMQIYISNLNRGPLGKVVQ